MNVSKMSNYTLQCLLASLRDWEANPYVIHPVVLALFRQAEKEIDRRTVKKGKP